jgi:hypothetical protein
MPELPAQKTPSWKDTLLLAAELAARNVYWRVPWLRAWVRIHFTTKYTEYTKSRQTKILSTGGSRGNRDFSQQKTVNHEDTKDTKRVTATKEH